jgi:hypothetical protein
VGHFAEDGNTDIVPLQVQNHAEDPAGELQQLHGHGILNAVHSGNTVSHGEDRAGFADIQLLLVVLDLLGYDLTDFFCFDALHALYFLP